MKLRFKHQKFQADAAQAVVDVFAGQPYRTPSYMMDKGIGKLPPISDLYEESNFTGWGNSRIELNNTLILKHIQKIQQAHQIAQSEKLEGGEA